ncbi:hypothetical protein [Massilia sp. Leaf139]|uniref:hypothetical protein n=1 Tax=Massilia sp. Leaf139 TaxID=1736272 RepID=UPI0006F630FA|nr:hypothetical protein [Massilia sp. Leaf139]KQQ96119.1 hypothetical protein ASF77_21685 [Massilia sp. Leaf139]
MSPRFATLALLSVVSACAQAQSGYPTVDKSLQKARDGDRSMILETELHAERAALAKAKAGFDALAVHRHTENIKALGRELAGTGVAPAPASEFRHDETAPLVVRAVRPPAASVPAPSVPKAERPARFWDPYTRSISSDGSTDSRRESP